jgi:serine/threonine-protein kinase
VSGPDAQDDGARLSEVGERATELDLSGLEPETVRPGLKRASLSVESGDPATSLNKEVERTPSDYLGYIIDGRYHVESIIAQGGMGVVYRCRHRVIDKAVAVKILRPDMAADREVTERFMVEARAASSVGNRHIIDVTDFGELPDGATYLVMEFLEGLSLATRMKQQPPVDLAELLDIGGQVALGLHAAHEAGIVHRDLKPDNIFLCREPAGGHFVKILDFGIAKVASSQNKVTRAGKIFGTPHYMAPEQGAGVDVDRRTDVYSLGVMLYELACAQVPFDAENPLGILTQHMYVAPVPPNEREGRKVPVGLEAIILKCLSKDPDHRYASMQLLYEDLLRVEQGLVPEAVGDLLARGTDELPLSRLRSAAREVPAEQSQRSSGLSWLGILLTSALLVALFAIVFLPLNATLFGLDPTVVTGASDPQPASKLEGKPMYTVALVLSPIDAHVFDGKDDLGTMPISIQLEQGDVATVEVRRDGFASQKAVIDGSRSKLIIQLEPLPGADLTTLPSATGHAALHDAGTRIVKLGSAATPPTVPGADAGAARPRKPRADKPPQEAPAVAVPPADPSSTPGPAPGPAPTPAPVPSAAPSAPAAPSTGSNPVAPLAADLEHSAAPLPENTPH